MDSQELYTIFVDVNVNLQYLIAIRSCQNLGSRCSRVRQPNEIEHAWFILRGCCVDGAGKSELFKWTTWNLSVPKTKSQDFCPCTTEMTRVLFLSLSLRQTSTEDQRFHFCPSKCQAKSLACNMLALFLITLVPLLLFAFSMQPWS